MKLHPKRLSLALAAAMGAGLLAPQAGAVNLATDGIGEVAIAPYYTVRDGWLSLINVTNTQENPVVVKIRFHEGRNSRDVFDINVALSGYDVFTGVIKQGTDGPVFEVTDLNTAGNPDSCVVPYQKTFNLSPGGQLAFSGVDDRSNSNVDGGPEDRARLEEGYVEFIVMGHADGVVDHIGQLIEGHNCDSSNPGTTLNGVNNVQDYFSIADADGDGESNILEAAQQFGEPINALKYNYRLLNPSRGVEVAGHAVTWANFYNPAVVDGAVTPDAACTITRGDERDAASATPGLGTDWDPNDGPGASCPNLLTAQVPFDFLEPTLNDAYPASANWWDDILNAPRIIPAGSVDAYRVAFSQVGGVLGSYGRGVDAVSLTIQRAAVINEWSSNATLGSKTNWIVTFPTKGFYVDQGDGRQFAVIDGDRDETVYCDIDGDGDCDNIVVDGVADSQVQVPYPPFAKAFAQTVAGDATSAKSCNTVEFDRYDRQENAISISGGVIPSPAPVLPTADLCYEANVLTFNGQSILNSQYEVDVDTTPLAPSEAGWMWLNLAKDDAANAAATVQILDNRSPAVSLTVNGGLEGWSGLPVVGFLIKQRTFGDVTKNYASAIDHAYQRN